MFVSQAGQLVAQSLIGVKRGEEDEIGNRLVRSSGADMIRFGNLKAASDQGALETLRTSRRISKE